MSDDDDVSVGEEKAFFWKVYPVSAREKTPLLRFIRTAIEARGCTIHHVSSRQPGTISHRSRVCRAASE